MDRPIPSEQQQIKRLEDIDSYLSAITDSETKIALRAILQERRDQVLAGYDAAHDAKHGVVWLLREAVIRIDVPVGFEVSRSDRVEAAALLLASLEVEAYTDQNPETH